MYNEGVLCFRHPLPIKKGFKIVSNILQEISLKMIEEQQIVPHKTGTIYYGNGSFSFPALLENGIYYFKFFPTTNISAIQSEIDIVNYLIRKGIPLPRFLTQNGKTIFHSKNGNMVFYASEFMDGDNDPILSKQLINDIVINIAQMHLKIKDFDKTNINIEKTTDYQRLMELYIKNQCNGDSKGIEEYLERIIKIGVDNVPTYPIHSDLYMGNVRIKDGNFKGIIDFSNLRESYFEDDLGKFFQSILLANVIVPEDIDDLIKLYESESGIPLSKRNIYVSTLYCMLDRYFNKDFQGYSKDVFTYTIQKLFKQLERKIKIDTDIVL